MKKILLVIAMFTVLLMTGCNKNDTIENSNVYENQNSQQQSSKNNNTENENVEFDVEYESRMNKNIDFLDYDYSVDFSNTLNPNYYYKDRLISAFSFSEDGSKIYKLVNNELERINYALVDGINEKVVSFRAIYFGGYHYSPEYRALMGYGTFDASSMIALTENGKLFLCTNITYDMGIPTIHFEEIPSEDIVKSIGIDYTSVGQPFFVALLDDINKKGYVQPVKIDSRFKSLDISYLP